MKVFVSYYRKDSKQKNLLIDFLINKKIDYYVVDEKYKFDGMYHQEIANIVIENMKDCDVTICLIGKETYTRPHIEHELKATLKGGAGERRGLVGLILENREDSINKLNTDTLPDRIRENLNNKYVVLGQFASFKDKLEGYIKKANQIRKKDIPVKNNFALKKLRSGTYFNS